MKEESLKAYDFMIERPINIDVLEFRCEKIQCHPITIINEWIP